MGRSGASSVGVVSRTTAAVLGGYLLTAMVALAGAELLPLPKAEGVLTSTLVSLMVMPCAVIWAFAARTARNAWLGVVVPAVALGILALVLREVRG